MPKGVNIIPKSSLGAFEILVCLRCVFRQNYKNGHGRLVGLTIVKSTRVENSLHCFGKVSETIVSGTCTSYPGIRQKYAEKPWNLMHSPHQISMSHL